ncbi:MAG: fibronectin type III domain-containing protein, partial [Rhizobiaceae bacterium]|nr:fibronectin type III domain-containing protein [Rhizobiaceae bacterium]
MFADTAREKLAAVSTSIDQREMGPQEMHMIVPRQVSRNAAATNLRSALSGRGAVWPAARQTILFLVAAFVMWLPFAQSAYAQSAGCSAINASWGGGVNLSNGNELWQEGLSVLAGETLTYSAVTSGTATPNSAGFAIYQNDGVAPSDILLEQYSLPGAELNLNNTLSIPEDDDRFILYAWSDPAGGTVQVTVTCVAKSDQTITFNNPGAQNFGTSPTLTASATSGLTPTFSSATTGVCTISSGGVLNFVTTGSCTINANQAGNASYNAATQVQQTFTVNAVVPGQPTIGTASAGEGEASVSFTAPASNGGSSIMGYTVTAAPGGQTGTGSSSPITVAGLTNGTAYTFTVTATNS